MTTRTLSVSNRNYSAQVTNEATDLGVGAPITPVVLVGIAGGLLGYASPLGAYTGFRVGSRILAEDTGRVWIVGRDSTDALVLVLETQGSGGSIAPLRGLLFVDAAAVPGGNGSIAQPYNTLQGALNAALANTTIQMTAGTYVEDVVMLNKEGIEVLGAGRGQTVLRNATNASTFSWVRTGAVAAIARFSMQDMTIECNAATATNAGVYFDADAELPLGPGLQNDFLTDGAYFTRVDVIRSVAAGGRASFLRRAGKVEWLNCVWRGEETISGTTVTENLGRGTAYGTQFTGLDNQWLRSNPPPSGGRNAFSLLGGSGVAPLENLLPTNQGGTILRGHPILVGDPASLLSGSTGVFALEGIGLTTTNGSGGLGPASAPIVQFSGTVGVGPSTAGSGRVLLPLPVFPAAVPIFAVPIVDFSRATFIVLPSVAGAFTVTSATGSFTSQIVNMNQSRLIFLDSLGATVAGSIVAGSVTVGLTNPVVLDVRGAFYYSQTTFSIAAGSFLDRSIWTQTVASFSFPAAAGTTITPPYPAGATYTVNTETSTAVAVAITAKSNTTVTMLASAAGASGSMTLTRT